jgi:hypothetical protein
MPDWQDLVAEGRRLVKMEGEVRWKLGDLALEAVPLTPPQTPNSAAQVTERLERFADELDLNLSSLKQYRQVAGRWPEETRVPGVSWSVHRVLSSREDRFDLIRSRTTWKKSDAQEVIGIKTDHDSRMHRLTPAQIVEAVRSNPDFARALARHTDTLAAIEDYGIEARAEKHQEIEAEHDRRRKGIQDAAADHARKWNDDLALTELRTAVDALGAAIMLKEEYGVDHLDKESELVDQVRRLIAAYESGSLTAGDQAWLDSLGVAS